MLSAQDCVKFLRQITWQEFFCKQLCWFPECSSGKKSRFCSVIGGILLKQNLLFGLIGNTQSVQIKQSSHLTETFNKVLFITENLFRALTAFVGKNHKRKIYLLNI